MQVAVRFCTGEIRGQSLDSDFWSCAYSISVAADNTFLLSDCVSGAIAAGIMQVAAKVGCSKISVLASLDSSGLQFSVLVSISSLT